MRLGSTLAAIFCGIVSVAHLIRLGLHISLSVGGHAVPPWMSLVACLGCGLIALLAGKELTRP